MRSREFIVESSKLWGAKVRISQANYVGYVDAQVWAPNAQIARIMFKQQYNIEDHHVGSVKEIKMKAKEFVKEAIKLPPGVADQAVQYISGPMLPKPGGQYRLQDVLKRVKELKDAIARAKQSGRLDVNSSGYKAAVAEIKKWADWLEASQAPAQPGDPVINIGEAYGDSDSLLNRIRAQQGTPTADNPEGRAELRRREQERQNRDEQARRDHQDLMAQLNDIYVLEKEIAAVADMKRQGISTEELDRALNQAFARYKQRWGQHHQYDPRATPEEKRDAEEMKQQAEVYMGQAQRVDQPGQLPAPTNEELSRVAKLAGVPVKEEWNVNMTEIYEAANNAARAIYCIGILTNRAFQQQEDPQGQLSERLDDVEEYQEAAEMAMDDLRDLGATLTYNRNSPRMFTLNVPKMKPYVFDIRDIVDSAVNG